ncbi:hypothetical protein [Coralloluteibacterium thermophilus]|uniref:Transmembrane protein n=1 Tax=Coralloluteibacterium thermophilum TaxID=2707049 RepID=A0ABV9NRG1_9GAMM
MHPLVEANLSLLLFLPWFVLLGALFHAFPRRPRTAGRRAFDAACLAVAVLMAFLGMHWALRNADPGAGAIWKQVLACSLAYGLFLLVLALGLAVRRRFLAAAPSSNARAPVA